MKLFYFKDPAGNFGDDLNLWLWPKVLPGILDEDGSCLTR
jgi:succinoglycan biosynthesis protein ExoV